MIWARHRPREECESEYRPRNAPILGTLAHGQKVVPSFRFKQIRQQRPRVRALDGATKRRAQRDSKRLPDRGNGSRLANLAVGGDKRNVLDERRRANDAIRGVFGISGRQLKALERDVGRYRKNHEAPLELAQMSLHVGHKANLPAFCQPSQFHKCDTGNGQPAVFLALTFNCRSGCRRYPPILLREPDQHVCVEQDQYRSPHSSGLKMGETISPLISILPFPFMKPKMSSSSCSTGTSLATGLPRLVMMTASRLAATWSMMARQRALNVPAGMVLVFKDAEIMVILPWSQLIDRLLIHRNRIPEAVNKSPARFENSISKLLIDFLDFDILSGEGLQDPNANVPSRLANRVPRLNIP